MKTTSSLYNSDMRQLLRGNSRVLISFGNIDTTAVGDASAESSTVSAVSNLGSLFRADRSKKYASLELNRWLLDGSFETNNDDMTGQAYVSKAITDEHGVFITPPTLVISFAESHTLPGITVNFETVPSGISVQYVDADGAIHNVSGEFSENAYIVNTVLVDCSSLSISITAMSVPYTAVRITSVMFGLGRVYDDSVILNVKQTNDVDPLSRWLPKEKLTFSIIDFPQDYNPDNPNGIYTAIDTASPVEISYGLDLSDGTTEWLKPDRYILTAKPTVDNNKATFTATGYTDLLTHEYYKGKYYTNGRSLYNLAVDVLKDAGVTEYRLDSSLKSIKSNIPLPVDKCNNLLQMIAHAGMCTLYTTDENVVVIEKFEPRFQSNPDNYEFVSGTGYSGLLMPFAHEVLSVIDNQSIKQGSMKVEKIPELRRVKVKSYQHSFNKMTEPEDESDIPEPVEKSSVFKSDFEINGTEEIRITFDSPCQDIEYKVDHGTLLSKSEYAYMAVLTVNGKGTVSIEALAYPATVNEQTITHTANSKGSEDDEVSNPLVSSSSHAKQLARHIASYLKYRNTYTLNYRGNPELETGDYVSVQTPFTEKVPSLVLTDEINYNGALSGKLTLKGGI